MDNTDKLNNIEHFQAYYVFPKDDVLSPQRLTQLITNNPRHIGLVQNLLLLPRVYGFNMFNLSDKILPPELMNKSLSVAYGIGLYFARAIFYSKPYREFTQRISEIVADGKSLRIEEIVSLLEEYKFIDGKTLKDHLDIPNYRDVIDEHTGNTKTYFSIESSVEDFPNLDLMTFILFILRIMPRPFIADFETDLKTLIGQMRTCGLKISKGQVKFIQPACSEDFQKPARKLSPEQVNELMEFSEELVVKFGMRKTGMLETISEVDNWLSSNES
jgi:hypothetical protein